MDHLASWCWEFVGVACASLKLWMLLDLGHSCNVPAVRQQSKHLATQNLQKTEGFGPTRHAYAPEYTKHEP